ncbi:hypothetical protein HUN01_00120 (plasmid) [Nostoc edaphicum CCNP1411]|uniref:Uncharacterized protein n=1 Tax=Nostoc edaphicum CCNP1411 TaxID=1472755 RepID=A0A7D7L9I5_9NOSO|nr:hypothetical protein [Nostoc edaphicum]QMS86074.1 hypothetical protein HUN01_00120 [Nostoc edaphicum CCNP1411]
MGKSRQITNTCCPIVAAIRPERTVRTSAVIIEIQPNFKVKGQRFSSLELKRLFNELVEASLAVWLDATTIEIAP